MSNEKMNKNKIIALCAPVAFLLFGIWIRIDTMSMTARDAQFPNLVAYATILFAIVDFVSVLRKKEQKSVFGDANLLKVLECLIAMCIYVFLLKEIGFILDTLLLTSYTMFALGYRNWKLLPVASVVITAAVFGVFYGLLNVPLPTLFL